MMQLKLEHHFSMGNLILWIYGTLVALRTVLAYHISQVMIEFIREYLPPLTNMSYTLLYIDLLIKKINNMVNIFIFYRQRKILYIVLVLTTKYCFVLPWLSRF